jgi:hypothetical protein
MMKHYLPLLLLKMFIAEKITLRHKTLAINDEQC